MGGSGKYRRGSPATRRKCEFSFVCATRSVGVLDLFLPVRYHTLEDQVVATRSITLSFGVTFQIKFPKLGPFYLQRP
jgi:hypothetical protein